MSQNDKNDENPQPLKRQKKISKPYFLNKLLESLPAPLHNSFTSMIDNLNLKKKCFYDKLLYDLIEEIQNITINNVNNLENNLLRFYSYINYKIKNTILPSITIWLLVDKFYTNNIKSDNKKKEYIQKIIFELSNYTKYDNTDFSDKDYTNDSKLRWNKEYKYRVQKRLLEKINLCKTNINNIGNYQQLFNQSENMFIFTMKVNLFNEYKDELLNLIKNIKFSILKTPIVCSSVAGLKTDINTLFTLNLYGSLSNDLNIFNNMEECISDNIKNNSISALKIINNRFSAIGCLLFLHSYYSSCKHVYPCNYFSVPTIDSIFNTIVQPSQNLCNVRKFLSFIYYEHIYPITKEFKNIINSLDNTVLCIDLVNKILCEYIIDKYNPILSDNPDEFFKIDN